MPDICFTIALLTSEEFLNAPEATPNMIPQMEKNTNRIGTRPFRSGDPTRPPSSAARIPVTKPTTIMRT